MIFKKLFKRNRKVNKNRFTALAGIVLENPLKSESIDLKKFLYDSATQFDTSSFTICNELKSSCQDLTYFHNSQTFVLTDDSYSKLIEETRFYDNVSKALNIDKDQAIDEIHKFLSNKTLLVQQTGVEGYFYKVGTLMQTAGPVTMLTRALILAKCAGVTGLRVLKAQPLLVVVLPTTGAIFFLGCGMMAGNTILGRTCNTVGTFLNLPMLYTELLYNSYISPVINRTLGVPTVLNFTKQVARRPDLDAPEALRML